ncbi:hypothetical protein N7466_007288 [Penicillium verhagenii]|uniref:uncharacterized protein n=1 Tax=Penicillium verhagenii TaxID=1562060 RepID=UPI00254561FB|nr:uncharacterized protein N7466_007288 [Penicillium verhagenii]KAJ5928332.1 hypothetical protein N7466_007288 [Penicillium verhagenii]
MDTPKKYLNAKDFEDVSYLKNRESTGDLFAGDKDIEGAFKSIVLSVASQLNYNEEWVNGEIGIFITKKTRQALFKQAIEQGITLFKGENLEVLAAPIEWALKHKLRRINTGDQDRKVESDIIDVIALLKYIKEHNNGPLDLEKIQTIKMNRFNVIPYHRTMQRVAEVYRQNYNKDIFE